jgi:hypothetical protein
MDTKKVVIRVYGQNTIFYGSDVVVEAPQGMDNEVIAEVVVSEFHRIPEPHWKEVDEEGLSLNDDTPDVVGVADNAEEPSVTLTETKDGGIRLFSRREHDG